MARAQVPQVLSADSDDDFVTLGISASEVVPRSRSSNTLGICANVSLSGESTPGDDGANAFVLFPGEELRLPAVSATALRVKYTVLGGTGSAILELIEIS